MPALPLLRLVHVPALPPGLSIPAGLCDPVLFLRLVGGQPAEGVDLPLPPSGRARIRSITG